MSYQIVTDSCADLDDEMKQNPHISLVPLTIQVGESIFSDSGEIGAEVWFERFREGKDYPKSACPSPAQYMKAWDRKAERVYYVTGSSKLSGSFNSAKIAVDFLQSSDRTMFCAIDSRSASAGQTLLIRKIMEWEESGMDFSSICDRVSAFRRERKTRLVLEDAGALERSGRLGAVRARLVKRLRVSPVLMGKNDGTIARKGQARGIKKALALLYLQMMEDFEKELPDYVILTHCACPRRVESFVRKLREKNPDLKVHVQGAGGIASLYAGEGAVIVAY